jgi:hypothetical protein
VPTIEAGDDMCPFTGLREVVFVSLRVNVSFDSHHHVVKPQLTALDVMTETGHRRGRCEDRCGGSDTRVSETAYLPC